MALSVGFPLLLSLGLLFLLSHPTGVTCVGRFPRPDLASLGDLDPLNKLDDVETYLDSGWLENEAPRPHPTPAQPGSYSAPGGHLPSLRVDGAGASGSGQHQSTYYGQQAVPPSGFTGHFSQHPQSPVGVHGHGQPGWYGGDVGTWPHQPAAQYHQRLDGPQYGQQQLAYSPFAPGGSSPYSPRSEAGSSSSQPLGHADAGNRYATEPFNDDVQQFGTQSSHFDQIGSSTQQPSQQPVPYSSYGFSIDDFSHQAPVHKKAVQGDELDPAAFWEYYYKQIHGPAFHANKGPVAIEPASRPAEAIPQRPTAIEPASRPGNAFFPPYERRGRHIKEHILVTRIPYSYFALPEVLPEYDFYSNAVRVPLPTSALSESGYRPSSYAHDTCFPNRSEESPGYIVFEDIIVHPEAERAMVLSKVRYELERWSQLRPELAGPKADFRPRGQDDLSVEGGRAKMMNKSWTAVKRLGQGFHGPFDPFVVNGVWIHFKPLSSDTTSRYRYYVTGWKPNFKEWNARGRGRWDVREGYDIGILDSEARYTGWESMDFRLKSDTS